MGFYSQTTKHDLLTSVTDYLYGHNFTCKNKLKSCLCLYQQLCFSILKTLFISFSSDKINPVLIIAVLGFGKIARFM